MVGNVNSHIVDWRYDVGKRSVNRIQEGSTVNHSRACCLFLLSHNQESNTHSYPGSPTNLSISDLKTAGRQNQSHQRCREEHLNNGNIPFLGLIAFGEGICRVYPESFGCSDSQVTVVLVECHEVHLHLVGRRARVADK